MLKVLDLAGGYNRDHNFLNRISFELKTGQTLAVFGQNGAGKSTLAKALIGLLPRRRGTVEFQGVSLIKLPPEKITTMGIGFFWQGGRVFPHLSVMENLKFAKGNTGKKDFEQAWQVLIETSESFKALSEHEKQSATYLSGGERHLLALAMILIREPSLLILDEPSAGLAPAAVNEIFQVLANIQIKQKTTILLIEQNIEKAISCSKSCLVLRNGEVAAQIDLAYTNAYKSIEHAMFDLQDAK